MSIHPSPRLRRIILIDKKDVATEFYLGGPAVSLSRSGSLVPNGKLNCVTSGGRCRGLRGLEPLRLHARLDHDVAGAINDGQIDLAVLPHARISTSRTRSLDPSQ